MLISVRWLLRAGLPGSTTVSSTQYDHAEVLIICQIGPMSGDMVTDKHFVYKLFTKYIKQDLKINWMETIPGNKPLFGY